MLQFPQNYSLSYSFTGFQQSQGDNSFPGTQLDSQLLVTKATVDQIIAFLAGIFNTDGTLKNASVTPDQLAFTLDTSGVAVIDAIATAIAFNATAGLDVNTVQAAIEALDAKKVDQSQGAYPASAIPLSAVAGLVATNVQAAIAELRGIGFKTGDLRLSIDDAVYSGWVPCNDGTIGDALSSATTLADSSAQALYKLLYSKVSNTYAPVTGGRGASADADWAAHKPIRLTKMLGRALAVAGAGSGLTSRALGQPAGVETATISIANLPPYTPSGSVGLTNQGSITTWDGTTLIANLSGAGFALLPAGNVGRGGVSASFTGDPQGGTSTPLSLTQPTAFAVNAFLRL